MAIIYQKFIISLDHNPHQS